MFRSLAKAVVAAAALVAAAHTSAYAQTTTEGGPDPTMVHIRFGPLWIKPTLALTNAGVDENVFNDPDGQAQRDFTVTVTPATDAWLQVGRTWVTGTVQEDVIWYRQFASERSANTSYRAAWTAPLNRVTFNAGGAWLDTRERPGYEIDARAQRTEQHYTASGTFRLLTNTSAGLRLDFGKLNFDEGEVFDGTNLHDQLNHTTTTFGLLVNQQLTPLTSIALTGARSQDRFDFNPLRDSDSTVASIGVVFDPAALLKGSATFGYRDFKPLNPTVPGYRGTTVAVDLAYNLLDISQFTVHIARDIQYSFDVDQPYYLQTGVSLAARQQVFGPVDVEGRIGADRLDYRDLSGVVVDVSNQSDHVTSSGGSVGYHFSTGLRFAFNVDKQTRESPVVSRQYDGVRFGTSVTYTF